MECLNDSSKSHPDDQERQGTKVVGADRVLMILKLLAEYPEGAALDAIVREADAAKSTVHRGLSSLKRAGLVEQTRDGRYRIGDELVRMAFAFHEARPDTVRIRPFLEELCEHFGEAAHYAVLDGRDVVYRVKVVPVAGGIQLTSTVGGRNPAHCTAVGKLLLAFTLDDVSAVRDWVGGTPLQQRTTNTITDSAELATELSIIRARGWATENEESEFGVCCLAVPYDPGSSGRPAGAISVSAIAYRTPLKRLISDLDWVLDVVRGSDPASDH